MQSKWAAWRQGVGDLAGATGRFVLGPPRYLLNLSFFSVHVLNPWQYGRFHPNHASLRTLVNQLVFSGIDALPILTLLACACGLAITTQAILTLQLIGERAEVIAIVSRLVVFELSTVFAAVILIGRSGSAISVDIGNMKLHNELESLQLLGINLNHFLLAPRLLGMAIAQLVLATYFAIIAISIGIFALAWFVNPGYLGYFNDMATALHPFDLIIFVIKNALFGLLIAAIACFHGLQVTKSRTELPQQTQRAIINSITTIVVLNSIFLLASQ